METQTIIAGSGAQDIEVYATDAHGRVVKPTSATCRIVCLDEPETAADAVRIVLATSAAAVDSLSTTTTAICGSRSSNTRLVPITAGVPVVGRTYVITSAGVTEAFVVERVDSLNIYARDDLRNRFASGATVTGCRVSASFPSTWANGAAELQRRALFGADWTFVGVTGPLSVRTFARIERRGRALRAAVSDLMRLDPRLGDASRETTTLEAHLQQADAEVSARMAWRGVQQPNAADGELGRMAVSYTALALAYRTLGEAYLQRAEWAEDNARRWLQMLTSGHKADDQHETTRTTDKVPGRRRATIPGLVIGS
jgi:hypothetical protein